MSEITPVPGLPGYYVRELTVRDALPLLTMEDHERGLRLVELAICDAEGQRRMADGAVLDESFRTFLPLLHAASAVNGLGEAQVEAAEGN